VQEKRKEKEKEKMLEVEEVIEEDDRIWRMKCKPMKARSRHSILMMEVMMIVMFLVIKMMMVLMMFLMTKHDSSS
jgi:hypothetical protein